MKQSGKKGFWNNFKLNKRKIALCLMLAGFSAFNAGFTTQDTAIQTNKVAAVEVELPAVDADKTLVQESKFVNTLEEVVVDPPETTAVVEPIEVIDNAVNLDNNINEAETVEYNAEEGMNYRAILSMEATAYLPGDGDGACITAIGIPATYGVVAVDPGIIPLGSRLYIPGYGEAVAADTGGAIYGYRIDLCMESYSEAMNFGRRTVTVYVLD